MPVPDAPRGGEDRSERSTIRGARQVLDTRAFVETPENVLLSFRIAGPGTRVGAYVLDLTIRLGAFVAALFVLSLLIPGFEVTLGLLLVFLFLLEWGYGCLFEGLWNGRTPGKRILGLRVIQVGGYSIGFYEALLRNLLRAADVLPLFYGVGFAVMFWSGRFQRLGDLVAGTMVVRERREILGGELRFLRDVAPIPIANRRKDYVPSDRTLSLIENFFRRIGSRGTARSQEIAWILARPLAARLGFAEDDEKVARSPMSFLLRVLRTFGERGLGPGPAREKRGRKAPVASGRSP